MTTLDLLPSEVRQVEPVEAPDFPIESGEETVGTLDADQIKLFSAYERVRAEAHPLKMMLEGPTSANIRLMYRVSMLELLFWYEVRETFQLWDSDVGIRRGYTVVAFSDKK